ncbi:hypothetical protein E4191_10385 [Paracoccus liaowanqingii]|uniref:Capsular biosynthesis protein n=1 Tax=Paracoccus liaowanqingii TaxID=2560053 RepID=A0A4P7HLL4_9RHOB|nr:hypothetical protein E4191_10385 [Paracoccus liaowanqingii]
MGTGGSGRRRVILEVPEAWFANPSDGDRHRMFYTSTLAALAELGLLIDPVWLPRGAERAPRPGADRSDLIISFHSYGDAAGNLLRCKESYIPPFYSLDPMGYACFSQLATQPELFQAAIAAKDQGAATRFRETLSQDLRRHNRSKYPQPDPVDAPEEAGYVFVPLQVLNDSVAKGAFLDPGEALLTVIRAASACGLRTVIKRHPRCTSARMASLLEDLSRRPQVAVSTRSIHRLIEGAALVVGANSGVLFEALVQGKPVVSYAASDFAPVTQQVRNHADLARAIAAPAPPDAGWRDRFLFWYLTDYCLRADDVPAIRRRIAAALDWTDAGHDATDLRRPGYQRGLYLYSLIDRIKRRLF